MAACGTLPAVRWEKLTPDGRHNWLVAEHEDEFSDFLSIGSRAAKTAATDEAEVIFKTYSLGVVTARDEIVYSFDLETLQPRVIQFIEDYNSEVDRFHRASSVSDVDAFVKCDRIKWSRDLKLDLQRGIHAEFEESKFRMGLYRPLCKKYLYYDKILNEEIRLFPYIFPTPACQDENRLIVSSDIGYRSPVYNVIMTDSIPEYHLCVSSTPTNASPSTSTTKTAPTAARTSPTGH